jgi:hypothetical protein
MSTSAGRVGLVEASTFTWVLPPAGGFIGIFFILEKIAPGSRARGEDFRHPAGLKEERTIACASIQGEWKGRQA